MPQLKISAVNNLCARSYQRYGCNHQQKKGVLVTKTKDRTPAIVFGPHQLWLKCPGIPHTSGWDCTIWWNGLYASFLVEKWSNWTQNSKRGDNVHIVVLLKISTWTTQQLVYAEEVMWGGMLIHVIQTQICASSSSRKGDILKFPIPIQTISWLKRSDAYCLSPFPTNLTSGKRADVYPISCLQCHWYDAQHCFRKCLYVNIGKHWRVFQHCNNGDALALLKYCPLVHQWYCMHTIAPMDIFSEWNLQKLI